MAVAFAQSPVWGSTGSETSLSFASAPANGSTVVVVGLSPAVISTGSVTDSHGVALTQEKTVSNPGGGLPGAYIALWDYTVSGTPTSTYSFSLNGGGEFWYGIYNLSGVGGSEFASNTSNTGTTPFTATIADVTSGDALIGVAWNQGGTTSALAISNGTNTTDVSVANTLNGVHSLAALTASTALATTLTGAQQISILLARYSASGGPTFSVTMTAGFAPTAGINDQTNTTLAAGLAPTATIQERPALTMTAGFTPTATIQERPGLTMAAGFTPSGSVQEQASLTLAAGLTFSGALSEQTAGEQFASLFAGLTFAGSLGTTFIGPTPPRYPPPVVAVQPTCTQCGSAVFCGGSANCPSQSLQLSYDAVPQNAEVFVSVPVANYVSMDNSGNRQFVVGKGF